jgi:Asp-tRNA(Asn)/Glu-tRNA(Gln) amidotransferase A subunit family amidase
MRVDEYLREDALGLAALVRKGDVAPHEVLEACLARLEAVNPKVNAVVMLDADAARDRLKAQPRGDGPFYGLPYFIKDLHAPVAGLPLAHGSRAFKGSVFSFDSETVARLRRAGFAIIGRTNSPEFGMSASTEPRLHGPTRNPWSLDHSAGGSSGGAAAAVAAGILPATHATDSGGSIRIPASANGLVGLKPTRGLLASGPHRGDPNHGISHEHAVTRTVRDCAAILDATAGPDVGAPYFTAPPTEPFLSAIDRPPAKLRIAVTLASFLTGETPDAEVIQAVEGAVKLLRAQGHEVEEARPDFDGQALLAAIMTVLQAGLASLVEAREAELKRPLTRDELEPASWAGVEFGRTVSGRAYAAQFPVINRAVRSIGQLFTRYDVLVTPTLMRPPARLGELSTDVDDIHRFNAQLFGYAPFTFPFNATGQPAASLPLGWSRAGLPIGVQVVGRFGQDTTLLRLARQLEIAAEWDKRRAAI